MAHKKWKETKLQPGTAGPGNRLGCSLVSFHFLLAILCPQAVLVSVRILLNVKVGTSSLTKKKCELFRNMVKDVPSF